MMLILGIDPGSTSQNPTGYALIDTRADTVLVYGLLKPDGVGTHIEDLSKQFDGLLIAMLRRHTVEHLAIEVAHIGPNPQTGLLLARIVGAYEGISALHDLPVRAVQPSQGKAALAHGAATKAEVRQAVKLRYGLVVSQHVADAIGTALASMTWENTRLT